MEIDFKPSKKQHLAFKFLKDNKTNDVLFGGAAGSGKTFFGCAWQIMNRLQYPGTRGLIAREELKSIKESTLVTFYEVLQFFGLVNFQHYKFNNQDFVCNFKNGSVIVFKELKFYPHDPEYERLGSTPFTDAFLEEASQIPEKAFEVVSTRLRWMISDYKLIPKILLTCNPHKGWLYKEFYKPSRDGTLERHRKFIQALVTDNPNQEFVRIYTERLEKIKDPITKARLLSGNWEYSVSDDALCDYEALTNMFRNSNISGGRKCLTADIARYGGNDTVIYRWDGFRVEERYAFNYDRVDTKGALVKTAETIEHIARRHDISADNIVVDEDGVGGGVVDLLPGCIGFQANSRPMEITSGFKENYQNLKTQCAYYAADIINANKLYIRLDDVDLQEKIITEADLHRKVNVDNDKKLGITSKTDIKKLLNDKSPDDFDNIIMRMKLELSQPTDQSALSILQKRENYSLLFSDNENDNSDLLGEEMSSFYESADVYGDLFSS